MTLSVHISPIDPTGFDNYVVYVSYGMNQSPTEYQFDYVFYLPNAKIDSNMEDADELKYTILIPPSLHQGNGTYIFGVRRARKYLSDKELKINEVH